MSASGPEDGNRTLRQVLTESPFTGNGTPGRLLTLKTPGPLLHKPPGACSAPYERAKADFANQPWYVRWTAGHDRPVGAEPTDQMSNAKQFQRECEKWPDAIPKSMLEDRQQQLADHLSGKTPLSPQESLRVRRDIDFLSQAYNPGPSGTAVSTSLTPAEQAWLEERNLRWGNTMGIAFLGPIYGGPGALARQLGASEHAVAGVNDFSGSLVGSARARLLGKQNAALRKANGEQIKRWGEYDRGVPLQGRDGTVIQKPTRDLVGFRRDHILNRHRAGSGKMNKDGTPKTEFPASWSDDKIISSVNRIATDPNIPEQLGKWNSPYKIGIIDGVRMRVDFYPLNHPLYTSGRQVSTSFPF